MLVATRLIVIMSLLVWAGTSISANMIAAPAKFQVVDLTRPVALQVGRAQFLWVGYLEFGLAVLASLAIATEGFRVQVLISVAVSLFLIQRLAVLPQPSELTDRVISGEAIGGSGLHLVFIGLEIAKFLTLIVAAAMALCASTFQTGRI